MKKTFTKLKSHFTPNLIEAGCDEAGRGCLAGPVVAAAVILPRNYKLKGLTDSKQLSQIQREKMAPIIQKDSLAWAVAEVSPSEIDQINILNASILAMHIAVDQLSLRPELLLIDGNRFKPYIGILHQCVVRGDAKFLSIAAASVLAKTHRDELMTQLGSAFPAYDWHQNAGYPTKAHRAAIVQHGTTPHHRMTFRLLASHSQD